MAAPSRPPYRVAAQEAEARATAYRQAEDWPSLLSLRLRMAARYPRLADPFLALVNDTLPVVLATHNALPLLAPLAARMPAVAPTVRADALAFDHLQARLMARLEGFAARRSIRIRLRRQVRARLTLTPYGPDLPWPGPPSQGLYVVSPIPRRVLASSRSGSGAPEARWEWPRLGILLAAGPTTWRPVALAHLLVQLGVFMGHHRRRIRAIDRAGRAVQAAGGSWPAQRAAMKRVAQEVGTPKHAVDRAEASGVIKRGYSRLLVWLVQEELRALSLAPDQPEE